MHCKYNLSQFDVDVNKYAFQSLDYILPRLQNLDFYLEFTATSVCSKKISKKFGFTSAEEEQMEPFKIATLTTRPCKCTWEFMNEANINEIRKIKKLSKLKQYIGNQYNLKTT